VTDNVSDWPLPNKILGCATAAHKVVVPNSSVAGSVLSKKHGFATFVHEQFVYVGMLFHL